MEADDELGAPEPVDEQDKAAGDIQRVFRGAQERRRLERDAAVAARKAAVVKASQERRELLQRLKLLETSVEKMVKHQNELVKSHEDVMKAGKGQLAAALVQAESAVAAAVELVQDAVKLRDETPPSTRVGDDYTFELQRSINLTAAVDTAAPTVRRGEQRVTEAGKIALRLHAKQVLSSGRSIYRLCRHPMVSKLSSVASRMPSLKRFGQCITQSRACFRELVGDVIADRVLMVDYIPRITTTAAEAAAAMTAVAGAGSSPTPTITASIASVPPDIVSAVPSTTSPRSLPGASTSPVALPASHLPPRSLTHQGSVIIASADSAELERPTSSPVATFIPPSPAFASRSERMALAVTLEAVIADTLGGMDYFDHLPRVNALYGWTQGLTEEFDVLTCERELARMRSEEKAVRAALAEEAMMKRAEAEHAKFLEQAREGWELGVELRRKETEDERRRAAELAAAREEAERRAASLRVVRSKEEVFAAQEASRKLQDHLYLTCFAACKGGSSCDRLRSLIDEERHRRWHQESRRFNIDDHDKTTGLTMLQLASFYGHDHLVSILLAMGASVSVIDSCILRNTSLHFACRAGHDACVKLLVDAGADPSAQDSQGSTPLHLACAGGRLPVVEALLPQRSGEIRDPHGLFELGFGSLPPFAEEPGVSALSFAGPLDKMPPRWRALATHDARKRTPVDLAYGTIVKHLVSDCVLELTSRMAKAKHLRLAAEASVKGSAGKLGVLKRTPVNAKSRRK